MKSLPHIIIACALALPAAAQSTFNGGNINSAANWSNGFPSAANIGTVAVDGSNTSNVNPAAGFGTGYIVNQSAGIITGGITTNSFNLQGTGTWNLTGGTIRARYVLFNGANLVANLSGGTVELMDVTGTQNMGVNAGAKMNISGNVVLDGTQATTVVQTVGTINISNDWTGHWTWGTYTAGTEWKTLFTTNAAMKVNGLAIDEATFDALFQVTDGGKTLSLINPTQATTFLGGDMLNAANWSAGLPLNPLPAFPFRNGLAAVNGTHDDANTGVANWILTVDGSTITAGQDWNFTGASKVTVNSGTINVADEIISSDDTVMTFNGGTVTWGTDFRPGGTSGGTIAINGGTFTGNTGPATRFGNATGGVITIDGGSVTASVLDFSQGESATLGGSAVLGGDTATFGFFNIQKTWTGSFTVSSFTGSDWQDEFTAGNITLDGVPLDATGFALNFTVSNDGKTLTYTPTTGFLGGDLLTPANWSNGIPSAFAIATINVDGTIAISNIGFGANTTVNMTAGTLDSGTNGFNTVGGGVWNISGGKIIARYLIANSQTGASTINLSGGIVELADVTGTQYIGVAHGGTLNISGTAVLDATQASQDFPTTANTGPTSYGTVDIKSNRTGTWTWGTHSGTDWENLFLTGIIKLDGAVLDLAGFEANFIVTDGGRTLARVTGGTPDPVPPQLVPAGFNGSGHFLIDAIGLDPAKTYTVTRGTDLNTFPDAVGSPVTAQTFYQFIDTNPPAGKAFYRLQEN